METQRQAIKEWLEDGKTITAHEAYILCGTMRLSAIIHHLRYDRGMAIADERIYTDQTNFSKYWLTADPYIKKEIREFLLLGNSITEECAREKFECNYLKVVINELREDGLNIVSETYRPWFRDPIVSYYLK